ncbi:Uncharacterized protein TCM_031830 [Theobroma cacao]|uniref:RNase H type-1 domain-containing protein n=1 Tax=Theobroma cacao TaxID=3641 RepID=A0A061FFP9_THECC|nr:Uncharacterized protein TCM_031830 [Theobroma cacao]
MECFVELGVGFSSLPRGLGWGILCHTLIIECDASDVVKWFKKPKEVPWRLRPLIIQTHTLLSKIPQWGIRHILRFANGDADSLAKESVSHPHDLLWTISDALTEEHHTVVC